MRRREIENVDAMLQGISQLDISHLIQEMRAGVDCNETRKQRTEHIPVKVNLKACNRELKCVQVFERIERQTPDCGRVCQCTQQVSQRIGDVFFGAATIDCNSHVLLGVTQESDVCGTIGRETDEDFTRSYCEAISGFRHNKFKGGLPRFIRSEMIPALCLQTIRRLSLMTVGAASRPAASGSWFTVFASCH